MRWISSRDLHLLCEELGKTVCLSSLGHVAPYLLPRQQGRLKLPTPTTSIQHREFAVPTPAADFAGVPPWKRVLDICFLLFVGPTLLPILLLIAVAIKLGSKGPVLFK